MAFARHPAKARIHFAFAVARHPGERRDPAFAFALTRHQRKLGSILLLPLLVIPAQAGIQPLHLLLLVIPAQAGIQPLHLLLLVIPAQAGIQPLPLPLLVIPAQAGIHFASAVAPASKARDKQQSKASALTAGYFLCWHKESNQRNACFTKANL